MSQSLPRTGDRHVRGYVEAKLADDDFVCDLRDSLYSRVCAKDGNYRQSEPHLTIIPPFTIDPSQSHKVDELIEASGLTRQTIPVTGVGVWPSIKNPRVVLLTTSLDIEDERQQLIAGLRELGAYEMETPVCPHITLFKTDVGYDAPDHVKTAIQEAVWDNRFEEEVDVQYVDFTVVERRTVAADD